MEDGFQKIVIHVGSMPSALCLKCSYIREPVGKHVVLGCIRDTRCTTQQPFDVFDTGLTISRNVSKKSHEVYDVGGRLAILHMLCVDTATDQNEQRPIQQVRIQSGTGVAVESKLLIEAEECAGEVQLSMRRVEVFFQVQDMVVLAISVLVEVLVGVIKQDALSVLLPQRLVTTDGHGLSKRRRILEVKPPRAKGIAILHPLPLFASPGSKVPFVDQQQVVATKGINRDGLLAHLVTQLVDVDDLHLATLVESPTVLVEDLCRYPGCAELIKVLHGQCFVGCQQQDVADVRATAVVLQVPAVLQDVNVRQQRLAGPRGTPEGYFAQVVASIRRQLLRVRLVGVEQHDLTVELSEQSVRIPEPAVEVDLCCKQRQILEVAPPDGFGPVLIDGRCVRHDVGIISVQIIIGETGTVENAAGEERAESRHSFWPHLLPPGLLDAVTRDRIEIGATQLLQKPAAEDQLLVEPQGLDNPVRLPDRHQLHILNVKHQTLEFGLDEANFPGLVRATKVLQMVVTVDVDDIELGVACVVTLFGEPVVELVGIDIVDVTPQNKDSFACGADSLYYTNVANRIHFANVQADEVVERLDQVNRCLNRLRPMCDFEGVSGRIVESRRVEQ